MRLPGVMEKKLIERRIYEKKAQKIIERLAEETVNLNVLNTLVRLKIVIIADLSLIFENFKKNRQNILNRITMKKLLKNVF